MRLWYVAAIHDTPPLAWMKKCQTGMLVVARDHVILITSRPGGWLQSDQVCITRALVVQKHRSCLPRKKAMEHESAGGIRARFWGFYRPLIAVSNKPRLLLLLLLLTSRLLLSSTAFQIRNITI